MGMTMGTHTITTMEMTAIHQCARSRTRRLSTTHRHQRARQRATGSSSCMCSITRKIISFAWVHQVVAQLQEKSVRSHGFISDPGTRVSNLSIGTFVMVRFMGAYAFSPQVITLNWLCAYCLKISVLNKVHCASVCVAMEYEG